jgi:hypothetical protein
VMEAYIKDTGKIQFNIIKQNYIFVEQLLLDLILGGLCRIFQNLKQHNKLLLVVFLQEVLLHISGLIMLRL